MVGEDTTALIMIAIGDILTTLIILMGMHTITTINPKNITEMLTFTEKVQEVTDL